MNQTKAEFIALTNCYHFYTKSFKTVGHLPYLTMTFYIFSVIGTTVKLHSNCVHSANSPQDHVLEGYTSIYAIKCTLHIHFYFARKYLFVLTCRRSQCVYFSALSYSLKQSTIALVKNITKNCNISPYSLQEMPQSYGRLV